MTENTREFFRIEKHLMVSFRRMHSQEPYAMTQTRDLSRGGMAIITDEPFNPGERIEAKVVFPFHPPERVSLSAEVACCKPLSGARRMYRVGLSFLNLSPDLAAKLVFLLAECKATKGR